MTDSKEEEYVPTSILLTGGAGFIGSNAMVYIASKHPDAMIVCLDNLEYCSNRKNFEELEASSKFVFVKGNICSADLVNLIISQYQIDTILHFAAETHVDQSFGNSLRFTKTNVLGTHVLLEAAKAHKDQIRRFIHVSTDEVYGESAAEDTEDDRNTVKNALNPTNPYAATKAAAEFLVKSYRTSFKLPTIITRGNNVYGPKQFPEKLIPKFSTLLRKGRPCPIHGDGSNRRSFLYVSDVAEAFEIIMRKGKCGEIYNIGAHKEYTNKQVLEMLLDEFKIPEDKREDHMVFVRDRCFNDFRYHICTKPLEDLGWKQKVEFAEGLHKTVKWYAEHADHWNDRDLGVALQAHPEPHTHGDDFVPLTKKQKTSA